MKEMVENRQLVALVILQSESNLLQGPLCLRYQRSLERTNGFAGIRYSGTNMLRISKKIGHED